MRQIRIECRKGGYGIFRTLEIVVDGDNVGAVKHGQSIAIDVPDDGRQIWGKMDWAETDRLELEECGPGQSIVFHGYFTWDLLKGIGVSKMPFRVFVEGVGSGDGDTKWACE